MTVYCIAVTFALAFVMGLIAGLLFCRGKTAHSKKSVGADIRPNSELINFLNYDGEQQ